MEITVQFVALIVVLFAAAVSAVAEMPASTTDAVFNFGGLAESGTMVSPTALYDATIGYGFEPSTSSEALIAQGGCITSTHPFAFSARVAEGNYRVTVALGNATSESDTTIKAESRRLITEQVKTAKSEIIKKTFTVNVRAPQIKGGGGINLGDRERTGQSLSWDDKLTLEFNGPRPCVQSIEIKKVDDAITIYIAGDSTVCDQPTEPWVGWGQMLPRFLGSNVAVANYAESGRALFSFRSEKRLDKILSVIQPGDYLFIQFGHNDQKDKRPGSGPMTSYKAGLEQYVAASREHHATPVLITPMYRRRFNAEGVLQESLGDYPAAVRLVAKEQGVALIDLHEMSGRFFQTLGAAPSVKAFVHYPANTFPGQTAELKDDTHFNPYGGYELARCIVEGIRTSELPLKKELADDVKPFDPSHPDAIDAVSIPASPFKPTTKPEGN